MDDPQACGHALLPSLTCVLAMGKQWPHDSSRGCWMLPSRRQQQGSVDHQLDGNAGQVAIRPVGALQCASGEDRCNPEGDNVLCASSISPETPAQAWW